MARPSTMPTQPVAPCTMRIAISASIEGAKGEAMQERTKIAKPPSSTGRRPKRSDSGPMTICETAIAARNSERMSWTRP